MTTALHLLKLKTPFGYKYYSYYIYSMGDYLIWSRDGKRYYISGASNSQLLLLPDHPFTKSSLAKKYLEKRIKLKDKFGIKVK